MDSDSDDDDEDDDKRSISSESTCFGEIKKETLALHKQMHQQSADFEIWRLFQVDDQNMREIPNAETILNALTAADSDGECFELFFFYT